ncbi:CLUMA_CG004285, isoform A [Clunio marinus]|uniref:CLUMA_CG004285, isoform A n=1 Tax=Clunio marinus TaxID=568069 RepID=A0A1J1HRA9_9DIPT|nr:CLUMA_CG004285, isoform A [Clunio marinus]
MDDNQCRVCLGETTIDQFSIYKRIKGIAIEEKLLFVCGLKIAKSDNFSKTLCRKCFNDICASYDLKIKCLDTDRTLKNLEKKFQSKLKEKVQELTGEILPVADVKNEYFEVQELEIQGDEADIKPDYEVYEEPVEYQIVEEFTGETVAEVIDETFQATNDMYEEIEYLEQDVITEDYSIEVSEPGEFTFVENVVTKFFCMLCNPNVSFNYEASLKNHEWEVHQIGDKNNLVCGICSYEFNTDEDRDQMERNMAKHFAAHERGKNKPCMLCPEVLKSKRNLENHQHRRHKIPPAQSNKCKGCQTDFNTYEELHEHLAIFTDCRDPHERPFKCYICNETFSLGVAKKKHVEIEHKDYAGTDCPLCLRCKIPSAVAYEKHYKIHFAAPRYCCNFCGRPFFELDRLQLHIKRSHQNLKFSCNWCEKTFRDKSGITRHILGVHFNQRNHHCTQCSKSFTASYNLKEHMFSVHKEASKIYTCEYCKQDFLYRKQYERHRSTCNGTLMKRRR